MSDTDTAIKPFVFTRETLAILKNFATINQSIYFREGNVISTLSNQRSCSAKAVISEEIPTDFAVYSLPSFLAAINLFHQPTLLFDLEGKNVKIVEGDKNLPASAVKYFFTEPSLIIYPEKDHTVTDYYEFYLSEEELMKVRKAAPVVKANSLVFETSGKGKLKVYVQNLESNTNNSFTIFIDAKLPDDADFKFIIDLDNLNILEQDYRVRVSSRRMELQTLSTNHPITYWIMANSKSEWG